MEEYIQIPFGEHKGTPINEVPMNYLVWALPVTAYVRKYNYVYNHILNYLLSRDIRIEDNKFYFNDYHNPDISGGEKPFLETKRLKNSEGKNVHAINVNQLPVFLEETDEGAEISKKYAALPYNFSPSKILVELNSDYFFYDNKGTFLVGAFLMEKPVVDEDIIFSESLPISKLEEITRKEKNKL